MEIKLKIPLKELLGFAHSGTYSNRHLQELYRLFYTIARRLVRRKIIAGKFPLDRLGLSEADITHDCIVELFTLGKDNELVELCKYFNYQRISIDDEEEEILLVHIRQLIFSIVNDNIFRLYKETDPALGRILRNIKIAVSNQTQFRLTTHFDEQFLELTTCHQLPFCATTDDDFIYHEIYNIMTSENEIPGILEKLATVLSQQDVYQRHVRLMSVALAIKNGYEQFNISHITPATAVEARFVEYDAEQTIEKTRSKLKEEMKPRYVDRKKVDEGTFSLERYMIEHDLTQKQTAKLLQSSQSQISRWLSGSKLTKGTIARIRQAFENENITNLIQKIKEVK